MVASLAGHVNLLKVFDLDRRAFRFYIKRGMTVGCAVLVVHLSKNTRYLQMDDSASCLSGTTTA